MTHKPGEVYLVDLGIAGKVRPMVIVSREDAAAPRALSICAPITSANRHSPYEAPIGKLHFLSVDGCVNVQGIQAIQDHELRRKIGQLSQANMAEIKKALRFALDL
jgi:mRNA interferase MazF